MSIVAAFDKTLFYNEASRYAVLQMKTADIMIPQEARKPYRYHDHLIRFTAVGYDLPRTNAVKMELEGNWVKGKYGCQLQVEHWREIVPPTLEGIRGYLASGLLKGIGEKTADAIVQRFGADSLNVIEQTPEKLLEIRGITEERLEEIKDGYAESKTIRELIGGHFPNRQNFCIVRMGQKILQSLHCVPFLFLGRLSNPGLQPVDFGFRFLPVNGFPLVFQRRRVRQSLSFRRR